MAKRIIMTRGLPGAGKTTWARHYQAKHPGTIRVSNDDLYEMLHDDLHGKSRENFVWQMLDGIIHQALANDYDVIVDDTNFHPQHRKRLEEIANRHDAAFTIRDFTDVPLETCITRDLKRPNSVGERAIRKMYSMYIEEKPPKEDRNPALEDAVICDIDGTLALFGESNPYDRDFMKDKLNEEVSKVLWHAEATIILVSGRLEKFRNQTEQWLKSSDIPYQYLYMRRNGDFRKDVLIKEEIYNEHIKGKYNITMVIDDRLQTCRMWYRLGLPLFRVGDPDEEF